MFAVALNFIVWVFQLLSITDLADTTSASSEFHALTVSADTTSAGSEFHALTVLFV